MVSIIHIHKLNICVLSVLLSLLMVSTTLPQTGPGECAAMTKLRLSQIGAMEALLTRQQSELHHLAEAHMQALASARTGGSTNFARRASRERQSMVDRQSAERAELLREQSESRSMLKCGSLAPNLAFERESLLVTALTTG